MYLLKKEFIRYTDQIGITGSFICLVHCIITSGVMIGSSIVSLSAHHHGHDHGHHHHLDFFGILDISMILVSGIAVYFASQKSHDPLLKNIMWGSYSLYSVSMLVKYIGFEPTWITVVSYSMSLVLIGCHLINLKSHKSCSVNV
ncbi:MerC domain-containing protein [Flammeovirga sp. EKP202]|uniref:MerC domain-containing protein n=1 Tax=Flammeovirga sp. EKP202 TaxID=2770592 RepID=UPI00165FAAD2|nr:MerC domain-containing protein [Flammeovirga sp. EKP202]MBD0404850.1 MerC domain-containing protein [Flammeovirga sp. EKP202]